MDEELRELERLFQAAQQAKSTARLSERSVVELIVKLQQLGLLGSDLLHTVSGKEYITQERLRQEIEDEINRLGRISLIELASSIGVDLYHCERQTEQIVSSKPGLMLVQGEIITNKYWDSLAEEVNETLKEASQVSIGELARRFNLSAELLTGSLSSRIGRIVQAKLEAGQLYTPEYVSRVKAAVRGAVRALTVPTSLPGLWSSLQSDLRGKEEGGNSVAASGGLFSTVLSELVDEGAVKGLLRGGGTTWTPAVFSQSQRDTVEAFYSQNAYISYDALKKLGIPQPKQYLQTKYPDGIALEAVFVHASFVGLLDPSAEEAIRGGGWFDAVDALPSAFGSSDSGKILLLCPSVQKALKESVATVMAETCIVSNEFVKKLLEKLQVMVQDDVARAALARRTSQRPPKTETEIEKGKKNEKKQREEMEEENGKPGKSKKKTNRDKARKTKDTLQITNKESADESSVPSEDALAAKIIEWHPDIEGAGTDEGFVGALAKSLAKQVRPELVTFAASLRRASLNGNAEERKKRIGELQRKVNEDFVNFQLFSRALDLFDDDKNLQVILQRHLLRTTGAEIADAFLESQALQRCSDDSDSSEDLPARPYTASARLTLAKSLPSSLSPKGVEMVEALEGKTTSAFESLFEEVVRESGLRPRKLDKKSERALLHSYCKHLSEEIDQETDAVGILPKVVALLYAQVHGRALQAPGRAMSSAVARLKDSLPKDAFAVLQDYLSVTVSLLAILSSSPELDGCAEDRVQTKKELLESRMAQLKALVRSVKVAQTEPRM